MADRSAVARFTILRQIYDLAGEQREALAADDISRFQHILDQREELIARLRAMLGDAAGVDLPENVVAFPRGEQNAAEDDLALDTVIRGILESDRHNEALLLEKMAEIREALPALEEGRRAAAGYRVDVHRSAVIDRTS